MKRLGLFLLAIFVFTSSVSHAEPECLDMQCKSALCQEKQVPGKGQGMLDFCQPPAFGTFAIEKDGITWHFGESVSYGQFINGDYWVLDKGDGVKVSKVTPGPENDRNGSMINPTVGTQAYDIGIKYYDAAQKVIFPAVLKAGDSLVSTASVTDADLNQNGNVSPSWYDNGWGIPTKHAKLMRASVLTVVSEVPPFGSFRPAYIGTNKKMFNISDINRSLLPNYKAPSSTPDVAYFERGVERPWLQHLYHYDSRRMHPVENMRNYHAEIGEFLSDLILILLTDAKTDKLLYGFIQTGIDHYATITSAPADNATFEFHSILTGLLLSDERMASLWVNGDSKTVGRATEKFYFPENKTSSLSSSVVSDSTSWTGFDVLFRKKLLDSEHEHMHPSEWTEVARGGGIKQEGYRHCCDSVPHFGMVMASRVLKAQQYWPNSAIDKYMDRWVWESRNGYGLDEIQKYFPDFHSKNTTGTRTYLVGSQFRDDMYLSFGFDPNGAAPSFGSSTREESSIAEPEGTVQPEDTSTAEDVVTSNETTTSEPIDIRSLESSDTSTTEATEDSATVGEAVVVRETSTTSTTESMTSTEASSVENTETSSSRTAGNETTDSSSTEAAENTVSETTESETVDVRTTDSTSSTDTAVAEEKVSSGEATSIRTTDTSETSTGDSTSGTSDSTVGGVESGDSSTTTSTTDTSVSGIEDSSNTSTETKSTETISAETDTTETATRTRKEKTNRRSQTIEDTRPLPRGPSSTR